MPEVTVVIPTFNERGNVEPLLAKLDEALDGLDWEAFFVDDDSPDGTADLVRSIGRDDGRIHCIQRIGRRGLSTAVVEGVIASNAPYVAVIDGDMQHDERLIPVMLAAMESENLDVAIGSRHMDGGGVGDWQKSRVAISGFATLLSRLVLRDKLTDPMSGFFMVRRSTFQDVVHRLSGRGFKILLDLFASAPQKLRFKEFPFQFRSRQHGESKLDELVVWEYAVLILDKLIGRFIPVRFIMFALVGASGVAVHFAALYLAFRTLGVAFGPSQIAATVAAMTSNFILNNMFTYRDRRLVGRKFVRGLLSFYLVCSVGALANVGVADFLFERDYRWWFAGGAGVLLGVVWNYAASSIFTWRKT